MNNRWWWLAVIVSTSSFSLSLFHQLMLAENKSKNFDLQTMHCLNLDDVLSSHNSSKKNLIVEYIRGYDIDGNEKLWIVTSGKVNSLAFVDFNNDGKNEVSKIMVVIQLKRSFLFIYDVVNRTVLFLFAL